VDLDELELELADLARRLEIEVRHVRYEGGGGLCVIDGRRVLMVNDLADRAERVATMAEALAEAPELDDMYLVPEVRRFIERCTEEGSP